MREQHETNDLLEIVPLCAALDVVLDVMLDECSVLDELVDRLVTRLAAVLAVLPSTTARAHCRARRGDRDSTW